MAKLLFQKPILQIFQKPFYVDLLIKKHYSY